MNTSQGKSTLSGTPVEPMGELIRNWSFDVRIFREGMRFESLSKNVVAWNLAVEDGEEEYDEDEEVSVSTYHTLQLTVALTVEALNEIAELLPKDSEEAPAATVVITYFDKNNKPLFHHSFTGEPRDQSSMGGNAEDTSPILFTLVFECTQVALWQRL